MTLMQIQDYIAVNRGVFRENYQYRFAANEAEIAAYCALRKKLYLTTYNSKPGQDEFDTSENVLIAVKDDEIVGGIRLIDLTSQNLEHCSITKMGFNLQKLFPQILTHYKCYIFDRLCAAPNDRFIGANLIHIALKLATLQDCRYMFSCTNARLLAYQQRQFARLGYHYGLTTHRRTAHLDDFSMEFLLAKTDLAEGSPAKLVDPSIHLITEPRTTWNIPSRYAQPKSQDKLPIPSEISFVGSILPNFPSYDLK